MPIFNFVKSSKYFYTILLSIFLLFIFIILLGGRTLFTTQKERYLSSRSSELKITKANFLQRQNEIVLELRRLVNIMNQTGLLNNINESGLRSHFEDILFDHNNLSMMIIDSKRRVTGRLNSFSYAKKYENFLKTDSDDIISNISLGEDRTNKLSISRKYQLIYLVKNLPSSTGIDNRKVVFFFSPNLMLKYLPENYAFIIRDQNKAWLPGGENYPADFKITTDNNEINRHTINDTTTIFYTKMYADDDRYFLAAKINTSTLKNNLILSTVYTSSLFTLFFALTTLFIFLRNHQINQLIETQRATVVCLANLAEFKDNDTSDHLERTRHYGTLLSKHLQQKPAYKHKIGRDYIKNIGFASVLHDIGKVGVPDSILKKPGKLDYDEFEVIKQHPVIAKEILKELVEKHKINDIFFTLSYNIAAFHHEKWDGSGYPDGLKGEDIPLEARIFALCDVYDALRSERVYKAPMSHEDAFEIINLGNGTHFDPDVVDAFIECQEQFTHIHDTYLLFYNNINYGRYGNNRRELRVEWNESLSVGIDVIDDQHKVLLNKINELIKAILEGNAREEVFQLVSFLDSYIEEHFRMEESIMEENNYEDIENHKRVHNAFRKQFKTISNTLKNKELDASLLPDIEKVIVSWLLNHIVEMDTKIMKK